MGVGWGLCMCASMCVFLWFLTGDRGNVSRICHPSEYGIKKKLMHSQLEVVVSAFEVTVKTERGQCYV